MCVSYEARYGKTKRNLKKFNWSSVAIDSGLKGKEQRKREGISTGVRERELTYDFGNAVALERAIQVPVVEWLEFFSFGVPVPLDPSQT